MTDASSSLSDSAPPLPDQVHQTVRLLRHEVGDFLQSVYASTAVLLARLPESAALERGMASSLRKRAEECRLVLDILHDQLLPGSLVVGSVNLQLLMQRVVDILRRRYEHLEFTVEAPTPVLIGGDATRLLHLGYLLGLQACDAAQEAVFLRLCATDEEARWVVEDDGGPLSALGLEGLFLPFAPGRSNRLTLGLAPARQIARAHGGDIDVAERPPTGLRITARLPREAPAGQT